MNVNMAKIINEGDILYTKMDSKFQLCKILRIDEDTKTFHTLTYNPLDNLPKLNQIEKLDVFIWHAPIASFPKSTTLTNIPVKENELTGYYEYLRHTDFKRFVDETGEDLDTIINNAAQSYNDGNDLSSQGEYEKALTKYTEAINLFPLFHEALDNRGLTYMDLGQWDIAILDFKDSLGINPDSFLAVFSIGECYFRLKDFQKALEHFKQALEIEPENSIGKEWLENTEKILKI